MRRITFLCGLFLLFSANLIAQNLTTQEELELLENEKSLTTLQQSTTSDFVSTFSSAFRNQTRDPLADIIPTAGATETFTPEVGDFFFDPGGPGGGPDGSPGNYPNCGCVTKTTLAGVSQLEFLDYEVFGTFDWLRLYDGTDATGVLLFDNGPGGNGANTFAQLLAVNGGTGVFNATSGNFFFDFNSTTVINRLGWEVEILATSGGGSASVIIDFEGPGEQKGAYASGTVNLSGFDFDMTEALIGSLANDFFNGTQSARFRGRDGSSMTMLEDKSNGLGTVSFEYRQYGTDTGQQPWAVEYSTNAGTDWTQIGDPFTATDVVQTFSETVEAEGDIRIRIVLTTTPGNTGNRRMNVDDIELTDFVVAPAVARVQVIHNSADPAAEFVDVYLDDVLLLEDFEFRTSTPFVDVPAGVPVSIDVAPAGSTSSGDSIFNLTTTLDEGETYLVIATGVIDPSQFDETVNSPIDFSLEVYSGARETAVDPTETDLLVHHGSSDAPTVDVVETSVPVGIIVNDISFPEFQGYLELIPDDYEIDITNADGSVVVASYGVPLTTLGLEGAAITVLASGFLDPSANQDGAAFGLWVSLASGGALVELPLLVGIPNEECDDAIALACGDVVAGSTTGATNSGGNASPDVFYSYTGSGEAELVTISLCDGGTSYDSLLRVFASCGNLSVGSEIALNDDFCGLQSQLTFESDGTSTYIIMVEGFSTSSGLFSLAITCELAPVLECGGQFVDTGGPGGNYSNNEDEVWTITPDAEEVVTVTFTAFDVEANWDALYVYDGPDTSSPLISSGNPPTNTGFPAGGYWGTTNPGPFSSSHPTGALTFRFLSDGSVTRAGWLADITCLPVPPPNDLIVNAIDVDQFTQAYTDSDVRLQFATNELLNPDGCAIAGTNGVWYKFTATSDGTAEASVTTPSGTTAVIFYSAPNENVTDETDLVYTFESNNQCAPSTDASITTTAGQSYYIYVLNTGGESDVVIDISNSLGTGENAIDGFVFYPNPMENVLHITSNTSIDNVVIYNMLGQKIMDQNIGATSTQLEVSNLATGAYLMKVVSEGQTGTYRLIKK